MTTKQQLDFKIVANKHLSGDYYCLELTPLRSPMPEILPGQFVNVLVPDSNKTFLRRPISVNYVDYAENILYLIVKSVGEGTKKLCNLKDGDTLNLLIPLGNGFTTEFDNSKTILLVGGGVGAAPLEYLASCLRKKGAKVNVLIGARTHSELVNADEFICFADVQVTTEDGSRGMKGLVTDHPWLKNPDFDFIMCCGPTLMMKAVANIARANNIECEVSLENSMACGLGACLCCVEDTNTGNRCVCTDGPVFNINELKL
ncbi:MAG: dihydroorotate dehydrogenase electron transfer subunit [Prevotella sp.]|nr:dihydroorotate dehydrogenase electron transfer subunit [Bacteroides sp.]MCM1365852.1 dihydroorotate dehydrogenase electron transfer subunit [Prevotella sp.]